MPFLVCVLVAALIPMITGFIWYNPKVFGNAWMAAAEMTEEKMKGANMLKIFGFTLLLSLMLASSVSPIVIHQMHLYSLLKAGPDGADPNSEASLMFQKLIDAYGTDYRTFKHGVFHGTLAGLFLALPIIGINSLFERKSFKYIAINVGYWILTLALMGGVLCAFVKFD